VCEGGGNIADGTAGDPAGGRGAAHRGGGTGATDNLAQGAATLPRRGRSPGTDWIKISLEL
jgi:hypothetical protein